MYEAIYLSGKGVEMKLAEALIIRSDLQTQNTQLRERLNRSAKVQEGEKPYEDPEALLQELDRVSEELQLMICRINKTNHETMVTETLTLADMLVRRDILINKRKTFKSLMESASSSGTRYSRSEIKMLSTVNVEKLQKQSDQLSKQIRETDTKIQEKNWLVELL